MGISNYFARTAVSSVKLWLLTTDLNWRALTNNLLHKTAPIVLVPPPPHGPRRDVTREALSRLGTAIASTRTIINRAAE